MKLTRILFIALLGFTLYACGGDDFDCETLELNIGDACDDGDDTTENDVVSSDCICAGTEIMVTSEDITYINTVKAILDNSCATSPACHAGNTVASFPMSTYDESVEAVGFGRILGAINQEPGFSSMPRGGAKLDQALIDNITEWINSGTPE